MLEIKIENFEIVSDKILIEPIVIDTVEESGVYIPNSYEDKPEIGRVIKIGEGKRLENGMLIPLKVSVGDIVYFNKYSSVKFRIGHKDYYTIREEDIEMYGKEN